jgi:hypothetical protein
MNFSKIYGVLSPTQWAGIAKILIPLLVVPAARYLGADTTNTIVAVVAVLVPSLGLSINAHTEANMVQTVAATKGSDGQPALKVLVAPTAPKPLLALATDTSVPEVVHAASVDPAAPPPKDPPFVRKPS